MVVTAIYSVTMVLWKETAFPLCRAIIIIIIIIIKYECVYVRRVNAAGKTRRSSTSTQLDPLLRRRLGSELSSGSPLHRVPTEHEEAIMLEAADLEDMASMLSALPDYCGLLSLLVVVRFF